MFRPPTILHRQPLNLFGIPRIAIESPSRSCYDVQVRFEAYRNSGAFFPGRTNFDLWERFNPAGTFAYGLNKSG
jgi:hypothetical protein